MSQTLAEQVAKLESEVVRLREDSDRLEGYERMAWEDASAAGEVKLLREFIADVRLGIRDLDEFEDVCDPVRL